MSCGIISKFLKDNHVSIEQNNALRDVSINYVGAGVYAKQVNIPKGFDVIQHKHKFDHLSILLEGSVEVISDDSCESIFLVAPASLVIKANTYHGVYALENSVWLCIHNVDETIDDIAKLDQQVLGVQ